jgi:hypothetical protein
MKAQRIAFVWLAPGVRAGTARVPNDYMYGWLMTYS